MWRSTEKPTPLDFDAILDGSFVVKESTKTAAPSSNSKGEVNGHLDGDTIKLPPPLLSNGNGGLKDQCVLSLGDNLALFVPSTNHLAIRVRAGLETIAFDKDDDDTLDFVTAASNLRSAAYYIERKTRWQVKEMASNIPAIATTNAIISGPIVLQALHLLRKSYTLLKNMHLQFKPAVPLSTVNLCSPSPKCGICRDTYSKVQYDPSRVTLSEPNHLANAPALILLSSLPKPPFNSRRAITPPAPSRKQTAPEDDTEVVTLAKRAKTNGASSIEPRSPSKKKRLEEDGLVMLYSAMDKMDDNDIIIEID
ncbi:repeat in ubiquitin-activating protein-domain-containing protein [Boletus edulis BED1]|uniref:Repeat in ubiquitin-activating protein-domain-containing protein n=1 Tax=Boletus edulis BED1 TaxID=1328754 RepID=A0AAD4BK27_BOLED|nr:repeat in ubiquitin-activating protein-domain-containing protein [Boletus edulis BED1]